MCRTSRSLSCCLLVFSLLTSSFVRSTHATGEPWTPAQLESPETLAKILNDPAARQPIVFCIGPTAMIKGSIDIGPAKEDSNLVKFRHQLDHLPKDADIVIYCGCCPFAHCPNVRPAFELLNRMKFTRQKLLNLEHNLKIDWINKGYPLMPAISGR
ncbi:MAG: rhodanese-like domain-containing protein [Bacteroidota bacterium]|nr:rhodanese-like domain-containing protein [Bacteroidota bacterium]MDP4216711.1 rhodanese-like domain-containing protein [Bacteroidota bacterium]MDP4245963.1 rhodanese-like domain-containing protein [Bacteroidota bacterium]MDP4253590.1 rhodanese-like domain-containing protein [Bacteroidota bacterium]MDP4257255.1 rhodanese-like domain-containing protein [Bacteroidota bacterium]